ncbi:MAG: hypothetical protein AAGI30_00205 [Planctomycetota bacterium]
MFSRPAVVTFLLVCGSSWGIAQQSATSPPAIIHGGDPPEQGWLSRQWMGDDADLFAEALRIAGLTQREFNFPPDHVARWGGDRYRLPHFDLYFHDLWQISPHARQSAQTLMRFRDQPQVIAYLAQSATGTRVRDNYYGSYLTATLQRVRDAGERSLTDALDELGVAETDSIAESDAYRSVPPEVRHVAAVLIHQIAQASQFRELGLTEPIERLGRRGDEVYADMFESVFWTGTLDDPNPPSPADLMRETIARERLLDSVDFAALYRGANTIMLGVQETLTEFRGANARDREINAIRDAAVRDDQGEVIDPEALESALEAVVTPDVIADLAEADFSFEVETPLGWVRLNGAGADRYGEDDGAHDLLIIDTAGDDHYVQAAATTGYDRPIGIAIDLSGDDTYESADFVAWDEYSRSVDARSDKFEYHRAEDHNTSFAAGICGYGVLLDLGGDDRYASTFVGQGAAVLGFGLLYDHDGDDVYVGDTQLQGAATFGTGVLIDAGGDDLYTCFLRAQGFGSTLGSGLLIDFAGDDRYHAVNSLSEPINGYTVKYAWFNTATDALNMAQGFGIGRRADQSDGHSWAGGHGVLIDAGGGNDVYEGDIYCQGSAYWYSVGMLYEDGGNDSYTTAAYSLASPPHFAVGIVIEEGGDDVYRGHSSRACGFGRDFSIGWFEEAGGDDRYYTNDSAFGVGNVNGLGVFWDKAGDDLYIARSNSFGQPFVEGSVGSARDLLINAGLFIDANGADTYRMVSENHAAFENRPFEWGDGSAFPQLTLDYNGQAIEMRDGQRVSWHALFEGRPGSTGVAIDSGL